MKRILALVLVLAFSALASEAAKIRLQEYSTGEEFDFEIDGDRVATLKEVIEKKTGHKVEDQRLYHVGDRPITEDIKSLTQLKPEPTGNGYNLMMNGPLGSSGYILVFSKPWKAFSVNLSGNDTIESLRQGVPRGITCKIFFNEYELQDDSKTLDYYQVGQSQKLRLVRVPRAQ